MADDDQPMNPTNRSGIGHISYMNLTAAGLYQEPQSWLSRAQSFVGEAGDRDNLRDMQHLAVAIQNDIVHRRVCTIDHAFALVQVKVMLANMRRRNGCETDEDTMVLLAASQFNRGNGN